MKSLSYKFFGIPQKLEDCLDFLKKKDVQNISLNLRKDLFGDEYLLTQLFADFELNLPKKKVLYSELCGGFLDTYSEDKVKTTIQKANQQLKRVLAEMSKMGYEIQNANQQF